MSLAYQIKELERYLTEVRQSISKYQNELKLTIEIFGHDSPQYLTTKARIKILTETEGFLNALAITKENKMGEAATVSTHCNPRRMSSPYRR
jgi:uncharacterized coiled-coil protein SlyX